MRTGQRIAELAIVSQVGKFHLTKQLHAVAVDPVSIEHTRVSQDILLEADAAQQTGVLTLKSPLSRASDTASIALGNSTLII